MTASEQIAFLAGMLTAHAAFSLGEAERVPAVVASAGLMWGIPVDAVPRFTDLATEELTEAIYAARRKKEG